jgi:hypothetical protein
MEAVTLYRKLPTRDEKRLNEANDLVQALIKDIRGI